MTSSRTDPATAAATSFAVGVETKSASFSFACRGDETLLAAGLAAGYELPYACSTGTCGTCRARVKTGDVDLGWPAAPGFARLKVDKGDLLMCQAFPRGDCAIMVPTAVAQPKAPTSRIMRRTGRVALAERLTRDVLHLEIALSEPMSFAAGQFVALRHAGVQGSRAYSMVNYGADVERLSFVVKRRPGGLLSDALFDGVAEGAEFEVGGPYGRATFRPDEARDIVAIAGGSGIAGIMAILEHARQIAYFASHRGNVFFGVRTIAEAFYVGRLAEHVAAGGGGLRVVIAISDEEEIPASHPNFPDVALARGFVHEVAATSMKGAWTNEIAFIAGPQPMVDAAIRVLITEAGIKATDIRFDKFS